MTWTTVVSIYSPSGTTLPSKNVVPSAYTLNVSGIRASIQQSQAAQDAVLALGVDAEQPAIGYLEISAASHVRDRSVLIDSAGNRWDVMERPQVRDEKPSLAHVKVLLRRLLAGAPGLP